MDTHDVRYRRPPLIEVVAEFRFTASVPWDAAIPGLLYQRLGDEYPQREPVVAVEAEVTPTAEGLRQRVTRSERVRFVSSDHTRLVQVGPDILSVHRLPPYESWEAFLPQVLRSFGAYLELGRPDGINRVGLRYLNRVLMPSATSLASHFDFYPQIPDLTPAVLRGSIAGAQWHLHDGRDGLRMQLAEEVSSDPTTRQYILDLDYFLAQPGHVAANDVQEWLGTAHDSIQRAFEASITDTARDLYGRVDPEHR
jgi:uncharacterized protein (TIGR04255 family)